MNFAAPASEIPPQTRGGSRWVPLRWGRFLVVTIFHLLAPTAVFFPGWLGFLSFAVVSVAIGLFGVTLGYHRLLTHRALKTSRRLARVLATLGALALQGGPITWVATHRTHHQHSDRDKDPHSPRHGLLWAHLGWVFAWDDALLTLDQKSAIARDISADGYYRWLERFHPVPYVLLLILLYAAGSLLDDWHGGVSMVMWGGVVRQLYVWHVSWMVNSLGHWRGRRSYETHDASRNLWFLAVLSFGEGWHNNHHARPGSAALGHRWYEVDPGYWVILLMKRFGLAWDVRESDRESSGSLPVPSDR